jgi:hypothetical protein
MADKKPPRPMAVVEDSTLVSLAANPEAVREFPFLAGLATRAAKAGKRSCGSCGRGAAERAAVYGSAKATLAGLTGDKKKRLKEILNAQKVRITYRNSSKKVIQLTF